MGRVSFLFSLSRKKTGSEVLEHSQVALSCLLPLLRAVGLRRVKGNAASYLANNKTQASCYWYCHSIGNSAFCHRTIFTRAEIKETRDLLETCPSSVGDVEQQDHDSFCLNNKEERVNLLSNCNAPISYSVDRSEFRDMPHLYSENNAEGTVSTVQGISSHVRPIDKFSKERPLSLEITEFKAFEGDLLASPNTETCEASESTCSDERGDGFKLEFLDSHNPAPTFQALLASEHSGKMLPVNKDLVLQILEGFSSSDWVLDEASRLDISSSLFKVAVSYFQEFVLRVCTSKLLVHLVKLGPSHAVNEFLFPVFAEFCIREFSADITRLQAGPHLADLTKPHMWFPSARAMKRRFVYHSGPTNSGKTYNALKSFMEASSGIYCGPLRLLAMEVYDNVNAQGVACSLLTGQEKRDVASANHLSCTIEMASTEQAWEVAVIDEAQLLTDEYRGCAWTRALLGLQANEIHLCGDPGALDLVRNICAMTGDELEEKVYERFTSLSIDHRSLEGNFCNVQAGDCIVAFSRKDVFTIKRAIEKATGKRCCVVYGALPPETRSQQAKLFNDPDSDYDVLVATDAVGMGLNLNIRRVVFYNLYKFNGDQVKPVSASQVKQIAGRAGRRGSLFPEGIVTTFHSSDLLYLVRCMRESFSRAISAGLFPLHEHMELFSTQWPNLTFSQLLYQFGETCRVDGLYFLCRYDNFHKVAYLIDKIEGLTLEDRLNFCFSPVNIRDAESMEALVSYAQAFSQKLPARLLIGVPTESARNDKQLLDLELKHQMVSLYLWLSQHFPEKYFPDKGEAEKIAANIEFLLVESLARHIDFEDTFATMLASLLETLRATSDRSAPPISG